MSPTRQQIYRRRRIGVFGGLLAVLVAAIYLPVTLLAPLPEHAPQALAYTAPVAEPAAPYYPPYGASGFGAIGYDGVLGSTGDPSPRPIASITKVITALVVLQAHPIPEGTEGATIRFDEQDLQFYEDQFAVDGTRQPVTPGTSLSQLDVIEVMLLASSNNHALSLARWAFGSVEAFAPAATAWLAEHGFASTVIAEPTGLNPGNVSTVADLIGIGELALADPLVAQVVATSVVEIPGLGPVPNRNGLLGVDGVDGIKTGTLDESGACLLFSADRTIGSQTVTIVGVVLGGPDHEAVALGVRQLLDQAYAGFRELRIVSEGDELATYGTEWGDTAVAVAAETVTRVVWSDTAIAGTVDAASLRLAEDGTPAGELDLTIGAITVTVPLVIRGEIDDPGPWWCLTNPGSLF